jgi:hypothetical protein
MLLLKLVELIDGVLKLKAFNSLNLFQLFFKLIVVFLSSSTLLTDLKLQIPLIFFLALLIALSF